MKKIVPFLTLYCYLFTSCQSQPNTSNINKMKDTATVEIWTIGVRNPFKEMKILLRQNSSYEMHERYSGGICWTMNTKGKYIVDDNKTEYFFLPDSISKMGFAPDEDPKYAIKLLEKINDSTFTANVFRSFCINEYGTMYTPVMDFMPFPDTIIRHTTTNQILDKNPIFKHNKENPFAEAVINLNKTEGLGILKNPNKIFYNHTFLVDLYPATKELPALVNDSVWIAARRLKGNGWQTI